MGPNDPIVARILTNYSSLPQGMGRSDEADAREARAGTIRAKHAEADPSNFRLRSGAEVPVILRQFPPLGVKHA